MWSPLSKKQRNTAEITSKDYLVSNDVQDRMKSPILVRKSLCLAIILDCDPCAHGGTHFVCHSVLSIKGDNRLADKTNKLIELN